MARCSGEVYLFLTSHSPAAMKSSKTFCFLSSMPAWCQASPNSPPPRRLASAHTPPLAIQAAANGLKVGLELILNPPYPVSNVGCEPSSFKPLAWATNIGILVPSLEGYQTCFTSYCSVCSGTLDWNQTVCFPVFTS